MDIEGEASWEAAAAWVREDDGLEACGRGTELQFKGWLENRRGRNWGLVE